MGDRYVLDTDTLVDVLRGRGDVIARLAEHSPDDLRISAISVAELQYGALRSRNPERNLAEIDRLLREIGVLSFGREAATHHARLRDATRAQPIGAADMIVAATALSVDAIVVSSNRREFDRVPGLRVEMWRNR